MGGGWVGGLALPEWVAMAPKGGATEGSRADDKANGRRVHMYHNIRIIIVGLQFNVQYLFTHSQSGRILCSKQHIVTGHAFTSMI